jgi:hypothetical protein
VISPPEPFASAPKVSGPRRVRGELPPVERLTVEMRCPVRSSYCRCRTSNKGRHPRAGFRCGWEGGCSIGGGSTAVVWISSPLLITR